MINLGILGQQIVTVAASPRNMGITTGSPSSLLTNLIAYWKLDETSGTRNDSVGANHLADNNTVTSTTGKIGTAGQFTSANNEYLSIADNADVSTGDIDYSVAAWVMLDSTGTSRNIIGKGNPSSGGGCEFCLRYTGGANVFIFTAGKSGGESQAQHTLTVSTGVWYFVVGWYNSVSNLANIRVNDGTTVSVSHTSGWDTALSLFIGVDTVATGRYWNGRIDEVGFWKRVLTAEEITTLYNNGNGITYPF